jgi:hypothetical protein
MDGKLRKLTMSWAFHQFWQSRSAGNPLTCWKSSLAIAPSPFPSAHLPPELAFAVPLPEQQCGRHKRVGKAEGGGGK